MASDEPCRRSYSQGHYQGSNYYHYVVVCVSLLSVFFPVAPVCWLCLSSERAVKWNSAPYWGSTEYGGLSSNLTWCFGEVTLRRVAPVWVSREETWIEDDVFVFGLFFIFLMVILLDIMCCWYSVFAPQIEYKDVHCWVFQCVDGVMPELHQQAP